jgi:hypothetical protein
MTELSHEPYIPLHSTVDTDTVAEYNLKMKDLA